MAWPTTATHFPSAKAKRTYGPDPVPNQQTVYDAAYAAGLAAGGGGGSTNPAHGQHWPRGNP